MADVFTPLVLHEDAFYEYFKPIRHVGRQHDIWGGHGLETFGEDFELVRRHNQNFLWTVVDGDSGAQWITTGLQYVNRVCYLITKRPHEWIPVEFRVHNNHSLTQLGLNRQLLKLTQLMGDC